HLHAPLTVLVDDLIGGVAVARDTEPREIPELRRATIRWPLHELLIVRDVVTGHVHPLILDQVLDEDPTSPKAAIYFGVAPGVPSASVAHRPAVGGLVRHP